MRCFLICTHNGGFWPVEEIFNEGGLQQSIEAHIARFNEEHRDRIRVFFPEMPTEVLQESALRNLHITRAEFNRLNRGGAYIAPRIHLGNEIIAIYDNHHS